MGVPGWPESAFWTPSIESVRMVLIHSSSSDVAGDATAVVGSDTGALRQRESRGRFAQSKAVGSLSAEPRLSFRAEAERARTVVPSGGAQLEARNRSEACCHSERRPKAGGEESQSSRKRDSLRRNSRQ